MGSDLKLSEFQKGGWCVIEMVGRLDVSTTAKAEKFLTETIAHRSKIAMDFSRISYISSAGLRILIVVAKFAKKHGKPVVICSPKGFVKETFEDFDIEAFYKIYDSIDEMLDKNS